MDDVQVRHVWSVQWRDLTDWSMEVIESETIFNDGPPSVGEPAGQYHDDRDTRIWSEGFACGSFHPAKASPSNVSPRPA